MNAADLQKAQHLAGIYRRWAKPNLVLQWHILVYQYARALSPHTAPEVWLSIVMQLAKG